MKKENNEQMKQKILIANSYKYALSAWRFSDDVALSMILFGPVCHNVLPSCKQSLLPFSWNFNLL